MNHKIIKANASDFKMLSDLCKYIYPQTYTYLWHDEGEWYLEKMYNLQKIKEELEHKNTAFYFLLVDDTPRGYLKVNYSFQAEDESFDIERIYLDQAFARKGFGNVLLNFGIDIAREMGRKTVYLKVMASSMGNIEFYQKNGFETVDTNYLDFETMKIEYRWLNTMKKIL
jgi:GNAT superfamily N-acetyltransferase